MGLDFIRDRKETFVQRRDRSEEELGEEDLLTHSLQSNEVELFRCRLTDPSAKIVPGYRLMLRVRSETHIDVGQAGKIIGVVVEDEAPALCRRMRTAKVHTGILAVLIVSEPDVAGEFMVKPMRPFKKP